MPMLTCDSIVCNFNVDVGPEIEIIYPPDTPFAQGDLSAICFNSFPEQQNTETQDDLTFSFSIANNSPDVRLSSPRAPHASPDTFYGSCVFRQEYDGSMKRSFNQRTLVLITHHNFPSFYHRLLHQMASGQHISDPTTLEAAHSQMATWPAPALGRQDLPFIGSMLTLDIAPHSAFPLQGLSGPIPLIHEKINQIQAYQPLGSWDRIMHFMPCISDLYILFEKLVLCESIIVIAESPQLATEAVSSLVDLARPIPYAGIVKPYATMQADFRCVGVDGGIPNPFIIGITNPFLLKRIVGAVEATQRTRPYILYLQNFDGPVPAKRHHSLHHKSSRNVLLNLPGGGIEARMPSKRFLKSDHDIISHIETLLKSGDQTHDIDPLVRRHFAELTAQFLAPINRYLAATNVMSPGGGQRYASFSSSEFMQNLVKHGTSLKIRGQSPIHKHRHRDGFYESFCQSSNFYSWLDMKLSLEKEASAGMLGATS
ncbi:unnamed protein product [Periconia digitata]|uniref:UDENN domain-containing protein n=1 Tax=Periconia digitata TaxID=1303443 RepID=A0A9W4UET5_9PLEO|nr:unnamed protein product [Periconia digitata]